VGLREPQSGMRVLSARIFCHCEGLGPEAIPKSEIATLRSQ